MDEAAALGIDTCVIPLTWRGSIIPLELVSRALPDASRCWPVLGGCVEVKFEGSRHIKSKRIWQVERGACVIGRLLFQLLFRLLAASNDGVEEQSSTSKKSFSFFFCFVFFIFSFVFA